MTAAVFVVDPARLRSVGRGERLVVDGSEGRHGAAVLRLRIGEPVELVDGAGTRAAGTVSAVPDGGRFEVLLEVATVEPAPQPQVTAALALLKGERMERAVTMLTEVGVDRIVPWSATRSVARWRPDRAAKAADRLAGTIRAAGKQSRRAQFPVLGDLCDAAGVAELIGQASAGIVLHEEATARLATLAAPRSGTIVVVIGPEGGLDPTEVDRFTAAGGTPVLMGPTVQRAETAAATGCAMVLANCGRWDAGR